MIQHKCHKDFIKGSKKVFFSSRGSFSKGSQAGKKKRKKKVNNFTQYTGEENELWCRIPMPWVKMRKWVIAPPKGIAYNTSPLVNTVLKTLLTSISQIVLPISFLLTILSERLTAATLSSHFRH